MTHRRHAMDNDQYWDHRPGDPVMTVDGYPGTVVEVSDGPVPGNEDYLVELHNGLGGGHYSSGQLSALTHARTASGHEAAGLHVASEDYPELGEILFERPDPGKLTFAAAQQAAEVPEEGAQLRDTDQPDSCSYCGSQDFTGQTDNGRVKQATCATCGGTMSAHPGAQWTPELIGDPSNHPSTTVDPASGASGAGGQTGINDLIDFDARVSTAAALHTAGQSFERDWHQHGDVSDDEYSALSNYSGNGVNEDLNPYLRGHQMPYTDAHDADAMNDIHQTRHHMDNLADRFSTKHPMTVYRTAPYGDVREGQELHDPGYMSTTEHQSVAKGYADRDHSLMKIHVPAGAQAIPMHHLVDYTGARGEVVLPRGSRVRVNQIHDDHIEGELLPHSGRKTAGAKEDDQIRESGLPLLSHDDSPGERFDKLSQHYEHLGRSYEDNSNYADSDHPLAAHHQDHGVPRFNWRTLADVRPEAKAAVATHLSGNIRRLGDAAGHHIGWPSVNIEHPHEDAGLPEHALGMYSRLGDITIHHDLAHDEDEGGHPARPWFASGAKSTLGHVAAHEFGHFMDDKKFGDGSLKSTTARSAMLHDVSRHIPGAEPFHGMGHGKDADGWVQRNREHIINHVGTYAATSPHELIAELYAEHHHSPNPSPAAQAVGHHLEGTHDDEDAEHRTAAAAARGAGGQGADARGAAGAREGGAGPAGAAAALNTTAATDGPDWCTWRVAAQCTFPNDRNNNLLAIPQVRGACPWETRYAQQICPISEPGPGAGVSRKGSLTAEGAIPPGPCAECGAQGHYDIEEENPDYHGDDENDPDAYRKRRETCEMCGGSGTDPGMSDAELEKQRKGREQAKADDQQWHRENVPHPDGVRTWRCGPFSACTFPVRPPGHQDFDPVEQPTPGRKERVEKAQRQRAEQLARTPQSTAALHRIASQMRTALGTED